MSTGHRRNLCIGSCGRRRQQIYAATGPNVTVIDALNEKLTLRRRILWITDPWQTLDHPKDTTLRWMEEASKLGMPQFWCDVRTLRLGEAGKVLLNAKEILSVDPNRSQNSVTWGIEKLFRPSDFRWVHYRPDPPVDLAYLLPLHLIASDLRQNKGKSCEVINPLEVLALSNEKIEGASLKDLSPPSLVSTEWEELLNFGKTHQRTVLKPLNQAQSLGIELLDWRNEDGREDAKLKISQITQQFRVPVMLQVYLEEIAEGETRLWFLDGKLLAHVKKLPLNGDFRVNMDRGSQLSVSQLSKKTEAKIPQISRHLRARGIRLGAVDLIGHQITDFNFTSPGLIVQMESILSQNLSRKILKTLVRSGH